MSISLWSNPGAFFYPGRRESPPPPLSVSAGGGMNCLRKHFFRKIHFSYKNEPASKKNDILNMGSS